MLNACPWKGNVRQLRNFCERLVIVTDTRTASGEQVRRHLEYLDPEIPQAPPVPMEPSSRSLPGRPTRSWPGCWTP